MKRAETITEKVTNATIVTELSGMRMAETTGDRLPVMAKLSPTTLYKNERPMLIKTIRMLVRLNPRKSGRCLN